MPHDGYGATYEGVQSPLCAPHPMMDHGFSTCPTTTRRFSNHDIQPDSVGAARQLDGLDGLEAEFLIDSRVDVVAAFEVAEAVLPIALQQQAQRNEAIYHTFGGLH